MKKKTIEKKKNHLIQSSTKSLLDLHAQLTVGLVFHFFSPPLTSHLYPSVLCVWSFLFSVTFFVVSSILWSVGVRKEKEQNMITEDERVKVD